MIVMDMTKTVPQDKGDDRTVQNSLPSDSRNSELILKLAIPIVIVFLLIGLIPLLAFSVSRPYSEQNSKEPDTRASNP
jgi:hypothetical protein